MTEVVQSTEYQMIVRLKKSRSARLRNYLSKSGFVIYEVQKMTREYKQVKEKEKSEDELISDDKTLYLNDDLVYECVYNGSKWPDNLTEIIKKIEEGPTVSYKLHRN